MGKKAADDAAAVARLEELYDRLPVVHCQGKCQEACTSIAMSRVEERRIRRRGVVIPTYNKYNLGQPCPALNKDGRCNVYEVRPFICRIYGAAEGLPCKFDCHVEGGRLDDADMFELLDLSYRIGGGALREEQHTAMRLMVEMIRRDPEIAKALRAWNLRGNGSDLYRLTEAFHLARRGGTVKAALEDVFREQSRGDLIIRTDRTALGLHVRDYGETL